MTNPYLISSAPLKTIIDFIRFGITEANKAQLFYGHGTDNAYDDIVTLILRKLSLPVDLEEYLLNSRLTTAEKESLQEVLFQRIINKIPVPYLIHEAIFCGLSFYVDQRVLIPRSPIAELINHQFSPWVNPDSVLSILDLCTGSACIALACCYVFPDALITAVDISPEALEVAAINVQKHQAEEQVTLIQSDCWKNVPKTKYDLIISNPPYVGEVEMSTLPEEYKHEPALALQASNNGLAIVSKILEKAQHHLTDSGILVVEVGNSEEELIQAYPTMPFTWLDFENGGQGVFLLTAQQLKNYYGR
jgi:ribosomal protein L3 glutamine methyltransferase